MIKFLFTLFLFISSLSYSQDWKFLFKEPNKTYYYKPNNENTAWIKIVSNKFEYYPTEKSKKLEVIDGHKLLLWQFKCNPKQMGIVQINVYSKKGKLISKQLQKKQLLRLEDVDPSSVGANL